MLSSSHPTATVPMTSQDTHFFKALGARIAELRREQGLSQQAVADELGIAQQTYAHYEVGRARLPASLLPQLSRLFGVATDELLGLRSGSGKRGPEQLHRTVRHWSSWTRHGSRPSTQKSTPLPIDAKPISASTE